MKNIKSIPLLLILLILIFAGCKREAPVINLEQVKNREAQKIIAPGMGTIGIIHDNEIFVYFLNESHNWILDKVSQFVIPEKSEGVLALGMGFIGVLEDQVMNFYFLNAQNQWTLDEQVMFVLPAKYEKVSVMRIPWDVGQIVIEEKPGVLNFYYLDEFGRWMRDETASFEVPGKIDDYFMLGSMEIGIISENKLGVYRLTETGEWLLIDDAVLILPENTLAVMAFEPGIMAVLNDNKMLQFYDLDPLEGLWYMDESMNFTIPDFD